MKLASDLVDRIKFERVHRMGPRKNGYSRNIVAKFVLFKEREIFRKEWKTLRGTQYFVHEQFPKEVVEKRKLLGPKLKAARDAGKNAWIA